MFSTWQFVKRRLSHDKWLITNTLAGVLAATTLVATTPIFLRSVDQLGVRLVIEELGHRNTTITAFARRVSLASGEIDEVERELDTSITLHLADIYGGRERFLTSYDLAVEIPDKPEDIQADDIIARFRNLTNITHHVPLVAGVMSRSGVETSETAIQVEAITSATIAAFFQFGVGDTLIVRSGTDVIQAHITGLYEGNAGITPLESLANVFLEPPLPAVDVDPNTGEPVLVDEIPPIPLFVTESSLLQLAPVLRSGALFDSIWFIQIQPEPLKKWTDDKAVHRISSFESEFHKAFPGSSITSPIRRVMLTLEPKAFLSKVPVLLLMAAIVSAVLMYLAMVISYLTRARTKETGLLQARGIDSKQLWKVYGTEAIAIVALSVFLAPFIGYGLVALAGFLPEFQSLTKGGPLPLIWEPTPFITALISGIACLAILSVTGVLQARKGLLVERLKSARPPRLNVLHRYNLDLLLCAIGGVVFWELKTRGQCVSGGLFQDIQINEPLLLAPILLLVVVGLAFMRVFPLATRFLAGESKDLLHLLVVLTVGLAVAEFVIRDITTSDVFTQMKVVFILLGFVIAYWWTNRRRVFPLIVFGVIVQGLLIGWLFSAEQVYSGELFNSAVTGFTSVIVGQVIFLILRRLAKSMPLWIGLTIQRLARSSQDYTWIVLLFLLVTGVGILGTTVGGTLLRSHEERVLYQVAADLRLHTDFYFIRGGPEIVNESKAVALSSPALRTTGTLLSRNIQVLGVESKTFHGISWYRDDFSERPLTSLMRSIRKGSAVAKLELPDETEEIGLWAAQEDRSGKMSINMLIEDSFGELTTVFLGSVNPDGWNRMITQIPSRLDPPLYLVAVHVDEHGSTSGRTSETGTILIDDIYVVTDTQTKVIDNFESQIFGWQPVITNLVAPDKLEIVGSPLNAGTKALRFSFGQATVRGVRGFYRTPSQPLLPVILSEELRQMTGLRLGDPVIGSVAGQLVPFVVKDTASFFPTLDPHDGPFIVADLEQLLGHLNVLGSAYDTRPNEIFVAGFPGEGLSKLEGQLKGNVLNSVVSREALLRGINISPAVSAGWKFLSVLSVVVAIVATIGGCLSHLLLSAERRRIEVGILQSMGLSRHQLISLITFEHVVVYSLAVSLGTWAGVQMSRLMVAPLAVTETGDRLVPPFILVTDWAVLGPMYVCIIGIMLAMLVVTGYITVRRDLATALKLDEG